MNDIKPSFVEAGEPQKADSYPEANSVIDRYEYDFDFVLANGDIGNDLFFSITTTVSQNEIRKKNCLLFLITNGGDANSAYKIGRFFQNMYEEFSVCVPSQCKSAGTLIACAANTLIMTPYGELGPLDVQLLKRDEIFERRSGLITKYALDELKALSFELFEFLMLQIKMGSSSITFKTAADISARICSDLMKSVYAHINLEALGDDSRNLKIAKEYSDRLNAKFNNLRPNAVSRLVHDYVSHDFVIDFHEAMDLFSRVEVPSNAVFSYIEENSSDIFVPHTRKPVVKLLTHSKVNMS